MGSGIQDAATKDQAGRRGSAGPAGALSILFPPWEAEPEGGSEVPAYAGDLNLTRVVGDVLEGRDDYELAELFWKPLRSVEAVAYRQDAMRDFERDEVSEAVRGFADAMRETRRRVGAASDRLRPAREQQAWVLDAAEIYVAALPALRDALDAAPVESRAVADFAAYLDAHTGSGGFAELTSAAVHVRRGLSAIRYTVHVEGLKVTVGRDDGGPDFSAEVLETFDRFRQGDVDVTMEVPRIGDRLDRVEGQVLDRVAKLFPGEFDALAEFDEKYRADLVDPLVARFDREAQFYLAYLEHMNRLRKAGLSFCYPDVRDNADDIVINHMFDLALANNLRAEGPRVVPNDVELHSPERVVVVTGPNQGGKTTFARAFGQIHHLARLGLPVPGESARVALCHSITTHFEEREDVTSLRGKLENDLLRVKQTLDRADAASLIVMNESFSSTSLDDAELIGEAVLRQIVSIGSLCVYVTFVDELSRLGSSVVSMVSTVDDEDPSIRTFRVIRRPADGAAYAWAIARKYGLTYDDLKRRLS